MSRVPDRGDLVWVGFTPRTGHEQAGRRPALVISPRIYHQRSKLVVLCPITSNLDPWPWKVFLPEEPEISGAVLADQVRSIDRFSRRVKMAGRAPNEVVAEVQGKLAALLGITF